MAPITQRLRALEYQRGGGATLLGARGGTLGARFQYRTGLPLRPLPFDAAGVDAFGRPYTLSTPIQPANPGGAEPRWGGDPNFGLFSRYGFRMASLRGRLGQATTDGGLTSVYLNGQWIDIATFLDQSLVLTVPGTVYELPDTTSATLAQIPAGQPMGSVYSYIQNAQGFWWQVLRDAAFGYVLFSPTSTVAPPAPPPPGGRSPFGFPDFSKFLSGLGTAGKWLVGGLVAVAVIEVGRRL